MRLWLFADLLISYMYAIRNNVAWMEHGVCLVAWIQRSEIRAMKCTHSLDAAPRIPVMEWSKTRLLRERFPRVALRFTRATGSS
jgi:hypothetical protein